MALKEKYQHANEIMVMPWIIFVQLNISFIYYEKPTKILIIHPNVEEINWV
mgnify:CR=1 FL=1